MNLHGIPLRAETHHYHLEVPAGLLFPVLEYRLQLERRFGACFIIDSQVCKAVSGVGVDLTVQRERGDALLLRGSPFNFLIEVKTG